jgi:hypothetical protein
MVALVSFDGRVYPNEAHTWDRLGHGQDGPHLLENAFEQFFSFATGRHTWISIQGQTIRGVASARPRGSRLAWELDCLIVATEATEPVLFALMEQLSAAAAQARVLRVFLRVRAGSDVLAAARKAGFMPYSEETLMRLDAAIPTEPLDPSLVLRPRQRMDGFALFRLYNAAVPVQVRQAEAATYAEWIAGQEKRGQGRGRIDLVAERDGGIVAWLRAVPDSAMGRIDLLIHPDAGRHSGALLSHAVQTLGSRRPVYCMVPSYAGCLASSLEQRGFERAGDYAGMVKRLALPARELSRVRAAVQQPLATASVFYAQPHLSPEIVD